MCRSAYRNFRIVGVEDGSFQKTSQKALLAAVLLQKEWIEDVGFSYITVDGLDATEKLIEILSGWKFDAVMLAGLSFGGFNIIDPHEVFKHFHKPVIVVSRTKPNNVAVKRALQRHFADWERRWKIFEKVAPVYRVNTVPPLYIEVVGVSFSAAVKILKAEMFVCRVPESLRVARLIARGLSGSGRNQGL